MSIPYAPPDPESAEELRAAFVRGEAARALAEARARPSISLADVVAGRATGPIPARLLRLRRQVLHRSALASSAGLRAASTPGETRRRLGGYGIEVIEDGPLVFVVLRLDPGARAPGRLVVEAGDRSEATVLPEPVDGVVQLMLNPARHEGLVALLFDPDSEMFLLE